jgi:hypothetical protein
MTKPTLTPEEVKARQEAWREAKVPNSPAYYITWNTAWLAARSYYELNPSKNTHWISNYGPGNPDPEMPVTAYQFSLMEHLVEPDENYWHDPEDAPKDDQFSYWKLKDGVTWADVDKAVWGAKAYYEKKERNA